MRRIWCLIAAFTLLLMLEVAICKRCHAEEPQMFLDDNPRFPLIYAREGALDRFNYLDLDSCTVISGDEDCFEISAQYVALSFFRDVAPQYASSSKEEYTCRFRKNEESGGELQVWDEHYDKKWRTFIGPHDEEVIEQMLDETGYAGYSLSSYYMFKCVYQHLFGEPYEDDWDDEALQRTVMILPRGKKTERHRYLWDDENYPCVFASKLDGALNLDKNSVYVEMESPSQCILRILVLHTPMLHYNDLIVDSIKSWRYLYDREEKKMYIWWPRSGGWRHFSPESDGTIDRRVRHVGEAAYYLAYGERFYGADQRWDPVLKRFVDVYKDAFYERLDGEIE